MIGIQKSKKITSKKLVIVGVSGLHGKTIVTELFSHMLRTGGKKVAALSSLGFSQSNNHFDKSITADNLDKKKLKNIINICNLNEIDALVIEILPSKIENSLFKTVLFDTFILTSLGLDFESFESFNDQHKEYFKLINNIYNGGLLLINATENFDLTWLEEKGKDLKQNVFSSILLPQFIYTNTQFLDHTLFYLNTSVPIVSKSIGHYAAINTSLAGEAAKRYVREEIILQAIASFIPPKGRFEYMKYDQNFVFIDKSTSPEVLKENLYFLYKMKLPHQNIITVLGVSDTLASQYAVSAEVATKYSNIVLLAPSDPGNKHVSEINTNLYEFAERAGGLMVERLQSTEELDMLNKLNFIKRINVVSSRKDVPIIAFDSHDYTGRLDAIKTAHLLANPWDIIVLIGKGADKYILFDDVEYEWSEVKAIEIAREYSSSLKPSNQQVQA